MSRHASPAKGKKSKKGPPSPVRRHILEDALENSFDASGQDMTPERARLQEKIEEIDVELRKAIPLLESSCTAMEHVKKSDFVELKAYANPPAAIMNVLSAVMTLLGKNDCDWGKIKTELADPQFIKKIQCYDKDNVPDRTL